MFTDGDNIILICITLKGKGLHNHKHYGMALKYIIIIKFKKSMQTKCKILKRARAV